jgi:hypothetical protein
MRNMNMEREIRYNEIAKTKNNSAIGHSLSHSPKYSYAKKEKVDPRKLTWCCRSSSQPVDDSGA